ncbi:MAG TPA: hypothetical protein DCG53_07550 [Syntrophus sp. (in: bacteria)]|jgi:hypothetical protein|nr:hypothetical protein [Syntrophus sp. (in: bacteria)]
MKSFKLSLLVLASVALILWVSFYFDFEEHDYSFMLENCACGKIVRVHNGHNPVAQNKIFKNHTATMSGFNLPAAHSFAGMATVSENIKSTLTGKGLPCANKAPPPQS